MERMIQDYLEGWQAHALSMMGRVFLVRSVLNSIPIDLLANAILSKTLVIKLEQHFQRFLCGSQPRGGGIHLLAWDVVCQPLRDGGLSI